MLPSVRSVVEQIFACDEGVMRCITTEEQAEICRRMAELKVFFLIIDIC